MDYMTLSIGLILLIAGASYFVEYAVAVAKQLRLHVAVFGAVIVAIGTSLPELAITIEAAFDGLPQVVVGNILGSNIANAGLVLGAAILLGRVSLNQETLRTRNNVLFILSLLFLGVLHLKWLFWPAGLLLLVFATVQIIALTKARTPEIEAPKVNKKTVIVGWAILALSLISVIAGSQLAVSSSLAIAEALGISAGAVAATILAIGTSLPELVITILAVRRKQHGLAIGNILGSNLMNLALIGGAGALIANLSVDIPVSTTLFFALFAGTTYLLASGKLKPRRIYGFYLLALYILFVFVEFING